MLEQEYVEHLIKTANNIAITEKEYLKEKRNLEYLKAEYVLLNDWESIIGKKKPTVSEKEAYITRELDEQIRKVDDLKLQVDYCRRMFEINLMAYKE